MTSIDFENEINPLIISNKIGYYISDGLRDGSLNLYSAYLLNHEYIRVRRFGYIQNSWNYDLSISGIIAIFMHYLCSLVFEEDNISNAVASWLKEDILLLKENRSHYITDILKVNIDLIQTHGILEKLSGVRKNYDKLSDDNGPYHNEVFPFHYGSPEDALLKRHENKQFIALGSIFSWISTILSINI